MQRITITVSDTPHPLAQDQDIAHIEAAALDAVRGGGDIVKVTLYGNRELAILVSPGVPITFEVAEVPDENRDDGDLGSPFEPYSSFINDYLD
ncbi:hypothetical protein ACEXQE_21800 [Herbiconiux sp. P17]|uniref:hypothetical protein n=1 Tax=Herbiconiux wuyangfengii TaxID=3342794 RepID=UPI0035BA0EC4